MSSFSFRPARRENVPLLVGLAGGTGSGKTFSAMLLAKGLAGGKRFAVIDTENGRARHYADEFEFDSADLRAPFRPERYAEAIEAADKAGYPVIVVDSMSHEHAGDGGLLDWHESEMQRLGNRDSVKFTAWIAPKLAHKAMVTRLLQVNAHVILCFRAEEKIEIVKVGGKVEVRPKQSLVGLDGWVPISEKTLPYELTASFLLTADHPGIPRPIKLQAQHRAFIPLDKPIGLEAGQRLAEWASGGATRTPEPVAAREPNSLAEALSVAELKENMRSAGIETSAVSEVGRRLFPGRSAGSLSDLERGELWLALGAEAASWADFDPVEDSESAPEVEATVESEVEPESSPFQAPEGALAP